MATWAAATDGSAGFALALTGSLLLRAHWHPQPAAWPEQRQGVRSASDTKVYVHHDTLFVDSNLVLILQVSYTINTWVLVS